MMNVKEAFEHAAIIAENIGKDAKKMISLTRAQNNLLDTLVYNGQYYSAMIIAEKIRELKNEIEE